MSTDNSQTDLHLIKHALLNQCRQYVQQRIATARQAMQAAQEAANSEEKSSAGDKYETGRAMAQLERDRHAQLLAEALKLEQELSRVDAEKDYKIAQPGSLVITDRGRFFVSISAGKMVVDSVEYFAISPASPIAAALLGKKTGDAITFNRQMYHVNSVG
ncbi:GreA/GreB family elongation factor [Spirosoma montaniterrae]|uniref:3-oxoacyl-ACP synthase n=1 Tax=Spirosoma montaniterrae TaxID=1178516 RepID=A0A1P9WRF5_9BACT|nr:GreA/GreB family elongation factor [Spirosoma montaniterrae]AQG77948.1 3-oxoacyl-ACP synthase [Spirosoma montaniterrae]